MTTDETDEDGASRSRELLAGDVTRRIIRSYFDVYDELGYGFLESVYRESLTRALRAAGFRAEQEVDLRVFFRGLAVGAFRADLIVDGTVIVEVKACTRLIDAHRAQLRNYLRATNLEVGLLLNFGPTTEFQRVLFTNDRKLRPSPSSSVRSV